MRALWKFFTKFLAFPHIGKFLDFCSASLFPALRDSIITSFASPVTPSWGNSVNTIPALKRSSFLIPAGPTYPALGDSLIPRLSSPGSQIILGTSYQLPGAFESSCFSSSLERCKLSSSPLRLTSSSWAATGRAVSFSILKISLFTPSATSLPCSSGTTPAEALSLKSSSFFSSTSLS